MKESSDRPGPTDRMCLDQPHSELGPCAAAPAMDITYESLKGLRLEWQGR